MPKRLIKAALILSVMMVACSIESMGEDHFATGDTFLKNCSVVEENTDNLAVGELTRSIECVAYMHGFIRGVFVQKTDERMPAYCPTGSTVQQDVRVVLSYLRQHPKDTEKPLPGLALQALKHAYPCRR